MITGCMSCSGDFCMKCRHWTLDEGRSRPFTRWGKCQHFTDHFGVMMQIYSGNIDFTEAGQPVYTTDMAKCRFFEGREG